MKIAVPAQRFPHNPAVIHGNLAAAPYFVVYDAETGKSVDVANPRLDADETPPNPLGVVKALGVEVVLCGGCGEWTYKFLEAAGVRVYLAHGGTVDQAIRDFLEGKLRRAVEER